MCECMCARSVQTTCTCTNISYERCVCVHLRRLSVILSPGQPKMVLNSENIFTKCQTVKNAKSSSFSSSNCFDPNLLTRAKVTGRRVTLYRTSNLLKDQHGSRILRVLRTVVFVAVVLVGREGWFFFLVESLPYIRRVIFCMFKKKTDGSRHSASGKEGCS